MRVLIACEFSGIVRDAFRKRGHDAWSCDLLLCERDARYHLQGDVCQWLKDGWDLMIAHPPCTHLAVSGARWFNGKRREQRQAVAFVLTLAHAPIDRIAIENPVGVLSTRWRKPDQIVQPWQFGHGEVKATCFWLKGLPALVPTRIVKGRYARVWRLPPSPDRWKERSRFYCGMARAMASQWGEL